MKEKLKIPKKSFLISTRYLKELKHQASGVIYNTRILKVMKQSLHKRNYNQGKFKKTTKGISNNYKVLKSSETSIAQNKFK